MILATGAAAAEPVCQGGTETAGNTAPATHHYSMHRHLLHLLCIADRLAQGDYKEAAALARVKLGLKSTAGKRDASPEFVEPDQKTWELGWRFRQQASRLSEIAETAAQNPARADAGKINAEFVKLGKACFDCHQALEAP